MKNGGFIMKQINMEKLSQYIAEGSILEFESDQACMEWFNTYNYQNFKNVEEMKAYQKVYGFNIGNKRYHINTDLALDVYMEECDMNLENKYPDEIMEYVRQSLGLDEDDESKDYEINEMSANEVFNYVCNWNGLIGYADLIKSWIEDIYEIEF